MSEYEAKLLPKPMELVSHDIEADEPHLVRLNKFIHRETARYVEWRQDECGQLVCLGDDPNG